VKEQLFQKCQSVTIGTSEKSTFQLSIKGLPPVYPLIKYQDQRYSLQFTPHMDGALMIADDTGSANLVSFEELAQSELAHESKTIYTVKLNSLMRGKVQVGPFTLLFQFVTPPPPLEVKSLPSNYRRFSFSNFDWGFAYLLLASLIFQGAPAFYMSQLPEVETRDLKVADREKFVQLAKEKRAQRLKTPPPKPKKKKKLAKDSKKKTKKLPDPTTPAKRKARRAAIKKNLMRDTALGAISGGVSLSMTSNSQLASAFKGLGLASSRGANGGSGRSPTLIGPTTGTTTDIDDNEIIGKRRPKTKRTKKRERKIKSKLQVKKADEVVGLGKLSPAQINRVVSRNSKRLQGCYESELKKDRTLRGVIKVRFTIQTNGRISSTKIVQNTMRSSVVARCIQNKIKRWRFKSKPKGGSVTVAYPFFFTPSN
jgi:TonB family protein